MVSPVRSEKILTETTEEEKVRLIAVARQEAYGCEGKLMYWAKYLVLFITGAAIFGVLTGIAISTFWGPPDNAVVAASVGAMLGTIAFSTRIETWLLRRYLARQSQSSSM